MRTREGDEVVEEVVVEMREGFDCWVGGGVGGHAGCRVGEDEGLFEIVRGCADGVEEGGEVVCY